MRVATLVGTAQGIEHSGVQLVGWEPFGVAVLGAIPLAGPARVVAVPVAVPDRRVADEVLAAAFADDQSCQEVIRGDRGALGVVLAAFGQQCLDPVEQLRLHQMLMRSGVEGAPEVDLADVDRVAQQGEHRGVTPRLSGLGAMTRLVQPVGHSAGALPAVGVTVEDERHQRRLALQRHQEPGGRIGQVAEGP
jgi:hypothetical protein